MQLGQRLRELREAKNFSQGSERILAVINFQPTPQTVEVDLSGVAGETLVELTGGENVARRNPFPVELPAYGYHFYRVK